MRYPLLDLLAFIGMLVIALGLYPFQSTFSSLIPAFCFAAFWSFRGPHDQSNTIANASIVGAKSAFLAFLIYCCPIACYELWSAFEGGVRSSAQFLFRIGGTAVVLLFVIFIGGFMAAPGGALIGAGIGAVKVFGDKPRDNHGTDSDEPSDQTKSR
jgi:hypothetical protein